MAVQNVQNKDMNLVLSSDAKPRLKWTPELHQRFIDAVNQLGGADKATPKSLMRVMGIHGLTLYHLKSHLQKYRLGKSQQSQNYNEPKPEEEQCQAEEKESQSTSRLSGEICDGAQNQINESKQIAQALQVQMEVQRKLYEQIEVQRHLQLRIEAQGKYLQSVLRKAQETLAGYNSSAIGVEIAKEELSQLVSSMVDMGCPSSSLSVLTDVEGSVFLKETESKKLGSHGYSLESSLTSSSESSGIKELTEREHETDKWKRNSVVLSLMEMQAGQQKGASNNQTGERKRNGNNIAVEQPLVKRFQSQKSDDQRRKLGLLENLDLNRKYYNDSDSSPKTLDLNCKGVEQPNGYN